MELGLVLSTVFLLGVVVGAIIIGVIYDREG